MVAIVAKLFRTLRLDAIVEPMRLFANAGEDASNQRPDIFIRNPRELGRQVIIDVAVTGVDGQSRSSDEASERPLQIRYDQKMAKYGRIAEQSNLRFLELVPYALVRTCVRQLLSTKEAPSVSANYECSLAN